METSGATSWSFFAAVTVAYLAACGGWLLLLRVRPGWWPKHPAMRTDHKWVDLLMVVAGAALVIGIGQIWRAGWLLPQPEGLAGDCLWQVNNLIIYAPIFVIIGFRRQSTGTAYLSARRLPVKILVGVGLGLVAVMIYWALRGELDRLPQLAAESFKRRNLTNFLPVFLEGVVMAFAFVRIRWAIGLWPALVAPAVLFALAHVPRQIDSGLALPEMAAYFAVTSFVAFAVLFTLHRSQDVIWLSIVHYLMDIAIGAFSAGST